MKKKSCKELLGTDLLLMLLLLLVLSLFSGTADANKEQHLRRKDDVQPQPHIPIESRIVGGIQASPSEYPYFVEWDGRCGASLIHKDIILSAAHCNGIEADEVRIGAYRRGSTEEGAETRYISDRRYHPSYDSLTVAYDYLVMKISEASDKDPVPINGLPDVPMDFERLTVMGFGLEQEGAWTGSTYLQEVNVTTVPHGVCNSQYSGDIFQNIMLCAGEAEGGKDSCQGDSGGPIIDSSGVQVGIVSWGNGCARPNFPGVYARISGVIGWIHEQICDLSDYPPDYCDDLDEDGGNGNGNSNGNSNSSDNEPIDGQVRVEIKLYLDNYPGESSLMVTDDSLETVLVDYPEGSFSSSGLFQVNLYLYPGMYTIKVGDSYGDGLCCGYGEGSFEVTAILPPTTPDDADDVQLLVENNGVFDDFVELSFEVPAVLVDDGDIHDDNSQSPTASVMPSNVPTNFHTTTSPTDAPPPTAAPSAMGTTTSEPTSVPTSAPTIEPQVNETVTPTTDNPTGMPSGSPSVDIEDDGDDGNDDVDNGDGLNDNENDHRSCLDDANKTFFVDSVVGQANCTWLVQNMIRYNYLCQFLDVAAKCKQSCDVCSYFYNGNGDGTDTDS